MIVIYGASGHGGMILEILESKNQEACFYDDNPIKTEYLQTDVERTLDGKNKFIIGVGDNAIRRQIASKLSNQTFEIAIDKTANISPRASIDEGSVVFKGAIVNHSTSIGKHVIVNTKASVDHDCTVGHYCHIAPGATICGGVNIGEGVLVGAGATILPNISIGDNVIIGAGAVVTKNINKNQEVTGVPARTRGNE